MGNLVSQGRNEEFLILSLVLTQALQGAATGKMKANAPHFQTPQVRASIINGNTIKRSDFNSRNAIL